MPHRKIILVYGKMAESIIALMLHGVNEGNKTNIRRAMETIQNLTCIQFTYRTNQNDYVIFSTRDADTCGSPTGRRGGK